MSEIPPVCKKSAVTLTPAGDDDKLLTVSVSLNRQVFSDSKAMSHATLEGDQNRARSDIGGVRHTLQAVRPGERQNTDLGRSKAIQETSDFKITEPGAID